MTTKQFADLRREAGMTQAGVAEALGIKVRTMSSWESASPAKELTRIEAGAARALFLPLILGARLEEMCEQAFTALPSEMVSIWIVQERDCILLPTGSRKQDMIHDRKEDVSSPQCISSLFVESLTTFPLRSGECLSLAGDAIAYHKAKKYRGGRSGHQFAGGRCESLLHVPAFTESAGGPKPVLLLSLENKLGANRRVIVPEPGVTQLYTPEEVSTARNLAERFRDELRPYIKMLDMIAT